MQLHVHVGVHTSWVMMMMMMMDPASELALVICLHSCRVDEVAVNGGYDLHSLEISPKGKPLLFILCTCVHMQESPIES